MPKNYGDLALPYVRYVVHKWINKDGMPREAKYAKLRHSVRLADDTVKQIHLSSIGKAFTPVKREKIEAKVRAKFPCIEIDWGTILEGHASLDRREAR